MELVPPYVLKTGISFGNKLFSISYQYSYTNEHFSDATNSTHQANAVNGLIPSYSVMDLSGKLTYKWFQIECGVNNLGNSLYFTRRAISYPGPGIIPLLPETTILHYKSRFSCKSIKFLKFKTLNS